MNDKKFEITHFLHTHHFAFIISALTVSAFTASTLYTLLPEDSALQASALAFAPKH